MIGTALDIMSRVAPPRGAFVDHPVGRTFGPPHDRARNVEVLRKALAEFPRFTHGGEIHALSCEWQADGGREWEDELRMELLHER
ncbi:MAG TPA: hypothetical protein VGH50_06455 [Candidatus Binatia bacterium]